MSVNPTLYFRSYINSLTGALQTFEIKFSEWSNCVGKVRADWQIYRAFHNVLRDYKHLKQENRRTYLNGIVHNHKKTEKVFFLLTTIDVRRVHG
jgi:predicted ABC-type exoprotein transport system permease subunit